MKWYSIPIIKLNTIFLEYKQSISPLPPHGPRKWWKINFLRIVYIDIYSRLRSFLLFVFFSIESCQSVWHNSCHSWSFLLFQNVHETNKAKLITLSGTRLNIQLIHPKVPILIVNLAVEVYSKKQEKNKERR